MSYPPGFARAQGGLTAQLMSAGRRVSGIMNWLMPGKIRAAALLVANDRTARALPVGTSKRVITLVENGVDLSLWTPPVREPSPSGITRFAFTGRLVDWKAVDLLLMAFKSVIAQVPATLDILGNGPMRTSLEAQAAALGISENVTFHGWVAQPQCVAKLAEVDALVLPSLYECGGAVVLEAMAMRLPVIASDWGGPADYLDAASGILVPPRTREQFVEDLAASMLKLAKSPQLRAELGDAGRRRVETDFDWERKVDRMIGIYQQAIDTSAAGRK
jgi:glycosyltransferase involved in cell wall biosynthesis